MFRLELVGERIKKSRLALFLASLLAWGCQSNVSPINDNPSLTVGVSVHESTMDHGAGLNLVRRDEDGLVWLNQVFAYGATPVVIVGYGDKRTIPERCAMAAATGAWIEVWNEPNLVQFWGSEPNPEEWVSILKSCREAAPHAILLGPGIGGGVWDWEFLQRATNAGMMTYLDIVTVHGYASTPETLGRDIAKVRSMTGGWRVGVSEWGFQGTNQTDQIQRVLVAASRAQLDFILMYDEPADGYELSSESLTLLKHWARR